MEDSKNTLVIEFARKVSSILERDMKDNLISVCLYGSAAKGGLRVGSDVDFLIVLGEAPASYHKRMKGFLVLSENIRETGEYMDMEKLGLQLEPSFLVFTLDEVKKHPPVLIDISYEGIILYDKKKFLKNQLETLRAKLAKLGAKRKITPHGYYWILKPDIKVGEVFEI
jgi:predicted nucleotidyltransferase